MRLGDLLCMNQLFLDNLRKKRVNVLSDLLDHESSFLDFGNSIVLQSKRPFPDYTTAIFISQQVTNLYVFTASVLTIYQKPQSSHIKHHSKGIKVFFLIEKTMTKLQLRPEMC